jgi:hypothetical protein
MLYEREKRKNYQKTLKMVTPNCKKDFIIS